MVESLQISAQLATVVEADLTKIAGLRERAKTDFAAREGVKLTYLPFFALAVCEALREHPVVNSSIDVEAGTVTYHDNVHLGHRGRHRARTVVPVSRMPTTSTSPASRARSTIWRPHPRQPHHAGRARRRNVHADQTGSPRRAVRHPDHQPAAGRHLGTGAVVKRPVVIDDPVPARSSGCAHVVYLALTYDHRMVDGADAARFLDDGEG